MPADIVDQVADFYDALFDRIFSEPFRARITQRLRRDAVVRQVQEAAGAASQSLTRFFVNEQLTEQQVAELLSGLAPLRDRLKLEDIANPNVTPETVAEDVLAAIPCSKTFQEAADAPLFRVALHSLVQVLMLVGPVMAEWQRLGFSSTFEMPRRVVARLNEISEQLDTLAISGQAAADERFEIGYRDYLLQRFHRIEAGTVRMTTSLDVDLRELFVMPRLQPRPRPTPSESGSAADAGTFMNLAAARRIFQLRKAPGQPAKDTADETRGIPGLEQVRECPRNGVLGPPGSGKSTFLEWLQLKVASAEEALLAGGQQAIPLLLRMRELDPRKLPSGAALIEKATASKDRAALMPSGWLERQMTAGRLLFMLDGLDETEPELRDQYVLPWLMEICRQFPDCRCLVSSRPVGYPPGMLGKLDFAECDVLHFAEPEVAAFAEHWCTAVRLSRNEPEEEARREGSDDGRRIIAGFQGNAYIKNLARNPLMLSAICLVNYFEGGDLPKDRAVLYRLCVEGLLHHWDQRRGIQSEFGLEEKLRACREVAIAMQADDRAEYDASEVRIVLATVLGERAEKLLEHIRRRTGLLLERRPQIFAFAHLTFQEYLAAQAVYEGNLRQIGFRELALQHDDGRWQEVIALYCSLVPERSARDMIEQLLGEPDSHSLAAVLGEAYFSVRREVADDRTLRLKVLERIAGTWWTPVYPGPLERFSVEEVAPVANRLIGTRRDMVTESSKWMEHHSRSVDWASIVSRLRRWQELATVQLSELLTVTHRSAPDNLLGRVANYRGIYAAPGFGSGYQAEAALWALNTKPLGSPGVDFAFIEILRVIADTGFTSRVSYDFALLPKMTYGSRPSNPATYPEFALLARKLAGRLLAKHFDSAEKHAETVAQVNYWAETLEDVVKRIPHKKAATKTKRPGFRASGRLKH